MKEGLSRRLAALENRRRRGVVVVYTTHDPTTWRAFSPAEAAERLADAQRRAGPGGTVIQVQYQEVWQGRDNRDGDASN